MIDTTENRHYINLEREENLLYINYFSHPFNSMAVMVYDISIPDNPVQSGRIIQHEFAVDRWNVEDQHVYGEDREYDRFTIWDVENLDSVRISGFYPLKTTYIDSDVRGQYAFVIEQQSFEIYNISQALGVQEEDLIQPLPIAFEVHSPYPNPFNSTVTVPFTLNQPLIVSYTVRNILGQLVLEGKRHAQAGEHQFHLSLPAEIRASSGMYTIEVEAGGLQQTRRAVFVK